MKSFVIATAMMAGMALTAGAQGRGYTTGNFALQLDGVNCGMIKNFEGGNVAGEVIEEPVSGDYYVKKHIGNVKYEDISMQVGFSMGEPMRKWIEAALSNNYMRKDGSIVAADFNLKARYEREFSNALITEIGFPGCDGSSKDPAYLNLKFKPEYTRYKKGSGKVSGELADVKQKIWRPSNFRLTLGDLDCSKVSKIESLVVRQSVVEAPSGEVRNAQPQMQPGVWQSSNLVIYLPEDAAQPFRDWHEDFVIKGNNSEDKEKNAVLTYTDETKQKELLTLTLHNVGIFRISEDPNENNSDKIRRVKVELYIERMEVKFGSFP